MRAFCLLLGILLAFLGVASATPTGTPTTLEGATRASLGPRRNGYSDLPSLVVSYNWGQPYNAIPEFVMANDPDTGNDAIIYTQEEIYTAMQQGYEVLQRTRDPSPGEFITYGNAEYPYPVDLEEMDLESTHWGRYGDNENMRMGWDWTGVPPGGGIDYTPPSRWNIASSQRQIWWDLNPGGMAPVGSIGMQVNSSNPPPVDMTPPGGPFDDDNPLQFPPWDNSTGVWQTYVPSNDTQGGRTLRYIHWA
ncbi:hypothetical protein LA080_008835 [Diaporthe eres]|nr:hypothetical protein LA080_008835 [Diaporthe eres]